MPHSLQLFHATEYGRLRGRKRPETVLSWPPEGLLFSRCERVMAMTVGSSFTTDEAMQRTHLPLQQAMQCWRDVQVYRYPLDTVVANCNFWPDVWLLGFLDSHTNASAPAHQFCWSDVRNQRNIAREYQTFPPRTPRFGSYCLSIIGYLCARMLKLKHVLVSVPRNSLGCAYNRTTGQTTKQHTNLRHQSRLQHATADCARLPIHLDSPSLLSCQH